MSIILNISYSLIYLSFLFFSIWGYGSLLKKQFKKELNFGETGIYGFVIIYLILATIHFFLPINYFVSLLIKVVGLLIGLKNYSLIKKIDSKLFNKFLIIIIIFFICSLTDRVHDDFYWYHLPTINYIHDYKIIFGIASLNDQLGYGQGYFYLSSLFIDPIVKINFIYHPSIIIISFFSIFMIEENSKRKIIENKLLFYFFISIILIKFTRFKEYGLDVFAFCIIGVLSHYLISFYKTKDKTYFNKSLLLIVFGFFIKQYVIITIFYLIYYFYKLKLKIFLFLKDRLILFLCIFISIVSMSKNIVQTGCLIYPIPVTCISSNYVNWSLGNEVAKKRFDHLKAYSKGIKMYAKEIKDNNLKAEEYLKNFKYSFHRKLILDKGELEKIYIVLFLAFVLKIIFLTSTKTKTSNPYSKKDLIALISTSSVTLIYWLWEAPSMRFGGYFFVIFFIFSLFFFIPLQKNNYILTFKKFNILIFCLAGLFVYKNIARITKEININTNFPKHKLVEIKYQLSNKFKVPIKISNHKYFCGNIKELCSPNSNKSSVKKLEKKNNYYFIYPNKLDHLMKIDKELTDIMYSIDKFSPTYEKK
ncbi:hypothetical protein IDH29_04205 [Pelagibacterales bacterium SAG-MED06]|nr:hypothetical protein [Pelagibacterales bacterium SAG-MED06]